MPGLFQEILWTVEVLNMLVSREVHSVASSPCRAYIEMATLPVLELGSQAGGPGLKRRNCHWKVVVVNVVQYSSILQTGKEKGNSTYI
jgi:hypothetical protein